MYNFKHVVKSNNIVIKHVYNFNRVSSGKNMIVYFKLCKYVTQIYASRSLIPTCYCFLFYFLHHDE